MKTTHETTETAYCAHPHGFDIRHLGYPLVIFFLVLLTACGSNPPGMIVKPNTDPCSLVTQEEASHILGTSVQPQSTTESMGTLTIPICKYSSSSQDPGAIAEASIGLDFVQDASTASNAFDTLKKIQQSIPSSHYQTISGIGDGAYFDGTALTVLKDNVLLIIGAVVAGNAGNQDTSVTLKAEKLFAQDAVRQLEKDTIRQP